MSRKKAKKGDKKVVEYPWWFDNTQHIKDILRNDFGIKLIDLEKKFFEFNEQRNPRYNIGHDHFKRIMQGTGSKPRYHVEFLADIIEVLTSLNSASTQATKRAHYQAVLLQSKESDIVSENVDTKNDGRGLSQTILNDEFKNAEAMRSDATIYNFLESEASEASLFLTGRTSSIMTRRFGRTTMIISAAVICRDTDIQLGPLDTHIRSIPDVEENDYVKKLILMRRATGEDPPEAAAGAPEGLEDRATYVLSNISIIGGTCRILGSVTKYFSAIATHDTLEHELLLTAFRLRAKQQLTITKLKAALKQRKRFFAKPSGEARHFAAVSLSTLIVYKSEKNGYRAMFRKRSNYTAVNPGLLHVIPACMFQYEIDNREEWDMRLCVIREYCEELFRLKIDRSREDPKYFLKEWRPAFELMRALRDKRCELRVTGVVLNLMNFRPEICFLLLVHDHVWFEKEKKKFRPNWEYVRLSDMRQSGDAIVEIGLDNAEKDFFERLHGADGRAPDKIAGRWVCTGLASLWLGIDAARARLKALRK